MPTVPSGENLTVAERPDVPSCDGQLCRGHGWCVVLDGGTACHCLLGYSGETCQDRVNEPIRVPLTLGVLGFIAAFVALLCFLAFVGRRITAYNRNKMTAAKGNSQPTTEKRPLSTRLPVQEQEL